MLIEKYFLQLGKLWNGNEFEFWGIKVKLELSVWYKEGKASFIVWCGWSALCVCTCVPWCVCRSQRANCGRLFPPSTMWVLETELRSLGWTTSIFYLLSHRTSLSMVFQWLISQIQILIWIEGRWRGLQEGSEDRSVLPLSWPGSFAPGVRTSIPGAPA